MVGGILTGKPDRGVEAWRGLLALSTLTFMVLAGACCVVMGGSGRYLPVDVLVIGDTIPDQSFFRYDPSIRYRAIQWPSWGQAWSGEEASRWMNTQIAARSFVPSDFVIELPYLSLGHPSIELRIRQSIEISMRTRNASILLPVPQTSLLASFAPDHTRIDDPYQPTSLVPRQNHDVLGGALNTQFSVLAQADPLTDFSGLVTDYHDANLFLMDPDPSAQTLAAVMPQGSLLGILGGSRPWLLRINLSDSPTGYQIKARGYAWKCASPLTGLFFFPGGGYVATSVIAQAGYVHVDNVKTGEEHDYAWDIVSHIILNSTGRDIPDLLTAHRARTMFAQYYDGYTDAYRALEFADMVSSSSQTYPVWLDLAGIAKERGDAAAGYIEGDIDGSIAAMEQVLLGLDSAKKRASKVLSLSLIFVHLAEYGVVTSVLLIALSITFHFVYRPRIKEAGISRYVSGGAGGLEAVQSIGVVRDLGLGLGLARSRGRTQRRRILALMALVVTFLVVVLVLEVLLEPIMETISWQGVYTGAKEYSQIDSGQELFTGLLVARPQSIVHVSPSEGIAWIGEDRPGSVVTRASWPFELVRTNQTSLLVYGREEDIEQFRVLSRCVGLMVQIRGKRRQPIVAYMDQQYVVQGCFELVPGSIRILPNGQ